MIGVRVQCKKYNTGLQYIAQWSFLTSCPVSVHVCVCSHACVLVYICVWLATPDKKQYVGFLQLEATDLAVESCQEE